jgi:hypothetical protein
MHYSLTPDHRSHSSSRCSRSKGVVITAAVEGDLDEAVLRRILNCAGMSLGSVYGRKGKTALLQSIGGYNNAARYAPWIVLVDLDKDNLCPPAFLQKWLAQPSAQMCFRIAVRAIEAWLLADREHLASFLGVGLASLPADPDRLDDPKREIVNLARRSRKRMIREDFVPRDGSGRSVGPLYTARMIEFVGNLSTGWHPGSARQRSASLARFVCRLNEFPERCRDTSEL